MIPTGDSYLDFVAMENEMTGAFPAETDKSGDTYNMVFTELYGMPLGSGEDEEIGKEIIK